VANGLIRSIGVSNFNTTHLEEAQSNTKNKVVLNQVFYNLLNREVEKDLLQYCQDNDVILEAFRPLDKGKLLETVPEILQKMAQKYNKTPAQIALNWLLQRPTVSSVILGARNEEQLKQNLGAVGWNLTAEQMSKLDRHRLAAERTHVVYRQQYNLGQRTLLRL